MLDVIMEVLLHQILSLVLHMGALARQRVPASDLLRPEPPMMPALASYFFGAQPRRGISCPLGTVLLLRRGALVGEPPLLRLLVAPFSFVTYSHHSESQFGWLR